MITSTVSNSRRAQIKTEAALLFRQKGYPATSMRSLATQIGVEAASLYNHFPSKAAILEAICFEMAEEFQEAQVEIFYGNAPADQRLHQAILAHVNILARNLDSAAVFFQDWRHLPEPGLSEFHQLRKAYEQGFRAIVQEGKKNGLFRSVDDKFTVLTILSALNMMYEWYRPGGEMKAHDVGEQLADNLINGITTSK